LVDWRRVLDEVDEALAFFAGQGVKPTLRSLFYRLVSANIIPNTKSSYKALSAKMVAARKEGRYPWDCIEDTTREVIGSLRDYKLLDEGLGFFEDRLREKLEDLSVERVLAEMFDYMLPGFSVDRWADQPNAVEIWLEKAALASTIESWVAGLDAPIRVNRGYASWTFIYDSVRALNQELQRHERVTILYLGDLDYSGVDIERFLQEALDYFKLPRERVRLVRLAVTPRQVEDYKLPPRPEDAETLAKLQRDARSKKYKLKYVIELDALVAFAPQQFRELLRSAIEALWDKSIFESLEARRRELEAKARDVLEDVKARARARLLEMLREGS
jgi:hypothetical protein